MMDNGDGRVVNPVNNQNVVPTSVPQSQTQAQLGQHQVPPQVQQPEPLQQPVLQVSQDELNSLHQAFGDLTRLQAQHSAERLQYIQKENSIINSIAKATQTKDMLLEMYAKKYKVPKEYGMNLDTGEFTPPQTQLPNQ